MQLIWNRKRQTALLTLEVLAAFLVLFALVLPTVRYADLWRQPLGFAIDDVWAITLTRPLPGSAVGDEERARLRRLLDAGRRSGRGGDRRRRVYVPVHALVVGQSGTVAGRARDPLRQEHGHRRFVGVLGAELAEGRWFSAADTPRRGAPS